MDVHLTGMQLVGVNLIGVDPIGTHLMGVHLTGMYLIGGVWACISGELWIISLTICVRSYAPREFT
jgi:hypothetical protein